MFNNNPKFKRGFTLVELLVVITIIGLLSTIVLISLSTARNKAKDANIKSHLSQARRAAEKFYNDNGYMYAGGTLGDLSAANPADMATLATAMTNLGSALIVVSAAQAYCISAVLIAEPTHAWCIDSRGISKSEPTTGCNGGTACP